MGCLAKEGVGRMEADANNVARKALRLVMDSSLTLLMLLLDCSDERKENREE